jgi:hypothetical protein
LAQASAQALRAGRSKAVLLTGDEVPQQLPAPRPFASRNQKMIPEAGAKMAAKRREWRSQMTAGR